MIDDVSLATSTQSIGSNLTLSNIAPGIPLTTNPIDPYANSPSCVSITTGNYDIYCIFHILFSGVSSPTLIINRFN
jgi:hypothetical protein